jgi:hypothetical protein
MQHLINHNSTKQSTYDHRLEKTGHPVRSAIYKLKIHISKSFNRANRHSVEFEALAALKGDLGVKGRCTASERGEQDKNIWGGLL